jgi:hypothetical protein
VHGNDNRISRIKIPNLLSKVRKRIEHIITLLSGSSPPDLVLNRNCTECEFEWQAEYGVVTISESHLATAISYVKLQEQHHRDQTLDSRLELY